MQTVNGFTGPIFTRVARKLFELCSEPDRPVGFYGFPPAAHGVANVLACPGRAMLWAPGAPLTVPIRAAERPSDVMVAFSGGKDSTALALTLAGQGLRPRLVHFRGINPSYPHESNAATLVARALGLDLTVVGLSLQGSSPHKENPVKNLLLLAILADLGAPVGTKKYALGVMASDSVQEMNWGSGFSDGVELIDAMGGLLSEVIPGSIVLTKTLKNETTSYKAIAQRPDLWPLFQSCMTPARYKPSTRKANERKFGPMLPGRCGSCYKCAEEYLHRALLGLEPLSTKRVEHCVEVLRRAWPIIYGESARAKTKAELIRHHVDGDQLDNAPLLRLV